MSILAIFLSVVVACVIFSLLYWAVTLIPFPAPVAWLRNVCLIFLIILACVWLADLVGWADLGLHRHWRVK